jgi:hypothetical protein
VHQEGGVVQHLLLGASGVASRGVISGNRFNANL